MGKGKRNRQQRGQQPGPQNPAGFVFDDFDDPIPMTHQGRVITPEVIAQMRAEAPEHADQLDAEWERMVLENNRPWLEDPSRLQDTEQTWDQMRALFPDSFADCGCEHPEEEQEVRPARPREEVRVELDALLAPTVPTRGLDPVQLLLRVEGMNSIEDFEATPPEEWRIDGRPLTREERIAILDMGPTDFMRYHLAQDDLQASGEGAQP
ncbi:hypothetical protein Q8791_30575 [Nocardiopsis sp. CT-R113]|uniref:Uncharacterized protein n=1 Tax=Nocardiopsis codii TaxID=3065942 RepID=A0ABU7KH55_9ACTN|nr:hypothetical protein [Nocardiopsis sp. CT-R113]MEE2041576.1 hypothetical protein [Nocardiopsis sp. CT-R113]